MLQLTGVFQTGMVVLAVLAATLILFHRRFSSRLVALGVLAVAGLAAWGLVRVAAMPTARRSASLVELRREIPRRDLDRAPAYAGSESCRACHPGQHASWHRSYHRTMTQAATPEAVLGDFEGVRLANRGRTYTLERRGEEFWVETVHPEWEADLLAAGRSPDHEADLPRVWRRIVMTTGSHAMQTYWYGSSEDGRLFNFPFTWLNADERWAPREDVFIRPPGAPRAFATWHDNCIECHATAAEADHDAEAGTYAPRAAELGIACEACHGPGDAHVREHADPIARLRARRAGGPDPTIVNPARLDPIASAQVCGQCHGMNVFRGDALREHRRYRPGDDLLETRLILRANDRAMPDHERADWPRLQAHLARQEPTFLVDRFWADGMVRVSGREHNAMTASACFREGPMTCLSCHSMHGYADPDDQLHPDLGGDDSCIGCHAAIAADVRGHTHHDPGSSGASCLNCHMPHTTYGLMKAIRSHHVTSPSVADDLAADRPNACTLCHLDRPLGWVADHLASWYGQERPALDADQESTAAGILYALTGDAAQRAIVGWHLGWEPALEASGRDWPRLYLAHLLGDPYPCVRYIAHRGLRADPRFEDLPFDFVGTGAAIGAARDDAVRRWIGLFRESAPDRAGPHLLLDADGRLDVARLTTLSDRRDDSPLDLRE